MNYKEGDIVCWQYAVFVCGARQREDWFFDMELGFLNIFKSDSFNYTPIAYWRIKHLRK